MSNERSPRVVCSMTMGTRALIGAWSKPPEQIPSGIEVMPLAKVTKSLIWELMRGEAVV